jgi:pyruvate,water dikinase
MTTEPAASAPGQDEPVWDVPDVPGLEWDLDDMHMPRAMPRLSQSYLATLVHGMNARNVGNERPLRIVGRSVNGYAYFAYQIDAPPEQHRDILEAGKAVRQAAIAGTEEQWRAVYRPEVEALYVEIDALPAPGAGPDELAEAWDRAWRHSDRVWHIHFVVILGPYQVLEDLADFVRDRVEGIAEADVVGLAAGEISELVRVDAGLDALIAAARAEPAVLERLGAAPAPTPDEIRALPGGAAFADQVEAFLAEHGHLGHVSEDLDEASWRAEPERLLADIGLRAAGDDGSSEASREERRARRRAESEATAGRIRAALADKPDDLATFESLLASARAIGWLTEGHNYWLDRMCGDRLRRFTRRIAARLVEAGAFDRVDDIRHLDREEVGPLLREPHDMRALIEERRAEHARQLALTPPRKFGTPAHPPADTPEAGPDRFEGNRIDTGDASLLRGTGASAGTCRATARVVEGPDDFARVRPGDIVVARASNPGWVPLFGIAGGFVTDTGGVLSHAAVVAREYGVPAVVGAADATKRIRDGQIVELDGTTGFVRLG